MNRIVTVTVPEGVVLDKAMSAVAAMMCFGRMKGRFDLSTPADPASKMVQWETAVAPVPGQEPLPFDGAKVVHGPVPAGLTVTSSLFDPQTVLERTVDGVEVAVTYRGDRLADAIVSAIMQNRDFQAMDLTRVPTIVGAMVRDLRAIEAKARAEMDERAEIGPAGGWGVAGGWKDRPEPPTAPGPENTKECEVEPRRRTLVVTADGSHSFHNCTAQRGDAEGSVSLIVVDEDSDEVAFFAAGQWRSYRYIEAAR